MAQIKIYGLKTHLQHNRLRISDAIHGCMVEILKLPESKKFHRFIALEKEDFIYPSDRSETYTIIEISMMSGRSKEVKKALIYALFERIEKEVGIVQQDIEITIDESAPENWGFRGKTGDEIVLDYKVEL